jgi:Domain of Unknown Function with PDB structure (DUF3857)/Domain of Unknown Function with PDB structure (DUF3858)/Transglutaminase-like superfamily
MNLVRCWLVFLFFPVLIPCSERALAADWPPISPDELKMTSEAAAPGAPAIILFREVDRDDNATTGHEDNFFRIKILKEEGRKYADVEIPYYKASGGVVTHISARTIQPDGTTVEFQGKPFDKSIVKAKGLRYMAKTFTLPDVRVGSIIEYSYSLVLSEYLIFDSHWILNDDLFTKHARFTLRPYNSPYGTLHLRWAWHLLPTGTEPPKEGPDHIIRMEVNNVPAFQTEDYMPPQDELKSRVDFTYSEDMETDVAKFWRNYGRKANSGIESYVGKHKALDQAVSQLISPNDAPEVKLEKIYDRVQQIRNLSYEREKTAQEEKRDKQKENTDVEAVWKRGYGYGRQLNWLFLAMARSAGFDAHAVLASDRFHYFFNPAGLDSNKLNADLVVVNVNGKDVFCDPGAEFTPFGLLMWSETGVQGLKLDKDGGTWIQTMLPESKASRIVRSANLTLSDTGDLEGKLTVTFTGLEAMQRRSEEHSEDDADKKKTLEDEAHDYIPAASDIELTNKPDWTSSSAPLVAEYKIKIGGWVSGVGRRALLPVGIFSAGEKHIFEHEGRVHQLYFEYPSQKEDDVTITLPAGWQVNSVPPDKTIDQHIVLYSLKAENNKGTVHISRKLNLDLLLLEQKYYPAVRSFFQAVRTGDDEQILLQPGGTTASN